MLQDFVSVRLKDTKYAEHVPCLLYPLSASY
jgi:hypothetical protein